VTLASPHKVSFELHVVFYSQIAEPVARNGVPLVPHVSLQWQEGKEIFHFPSYTIEVWLMDAECFGLKNDYEVEQQLLRQLEEGRPCIQRTTDNARHVYDNARFGLASEVR
jgi:hypothetical protein